VIRGYDATRLRDTLCLLPGDLLSVVSLPFSLAAAGAFLYLQPASYTISLCLYIVFTKRFFVYILFSVLCVMLPAIAAGH
jgi:hypothetical protein